MSAPNEEPSHDGDWGWEPLGSEDEEPQNAPGVIIHGKIESGSIDASDGKQASMNKRNSSEKSLTAKRGSFSGQKSLPGIVSSPSFLELEKAIGATLNLASNDSGDLNEHRLQSPTTTLPPSRLSSTNLTQQKVNQQRLRQQQHQGQRYSSQNQYSRSPAAGPYSYNNFPNAYTAMPPPMPQLQHLSVPAKTELTPFINEGESRAIILFHSIHVSAADIRNACSKHGVLYYIRPEFHGKGVTLISYFDLRAATSAKACIAEDLGPNAEASAHYSVMLHAANSNSEEFRLEVQNLPSNNSSETEVEAIFARYGQLRSIQKTFEQPSSKSLPSSPSNKPDRIGSAEGMESKALDAEATKTNVTADLEAVAAAASAPESSSVTNSITNQSCKIAYSIEYYNIQDARLAASELSATSVQLWNTTEVAVKFAPLDERKQQLCRQLLAILSRWRTEMAAMVSSSAAAAMTYNFSVQHHAQQYGVNMNSVMGMPGGMGYSLMQQPQQSQIGRFGPAGLSLGPPVGMGMMSMMGVPGPDGVSYFDPNSAYYSPQQQQQQMYVQQQNQLSPQQQMQQYMVSAVAGMSVASHRGGSFDPSNGSSGTPVVAVHQQPLQPMPMSVHAMAGLMYQQQTSMEGADGAARASPMQSLMPANLSNPNLFNLGLLAAQAEAQMQQQHQQLLPTVDGSGGDSVLSSREMDPQQRPGFHVHQQHQQQPIFQTAGSNNKYGHQQQQPYQGGHAPRQGGRGPSVPPPHHQQHHQNGGFASGAPLHHHQQHHMQMQYNTINNNGIGGGQALGRRSAKLSPGTGQYAYSPFPTSTTNGGAASVRNGEQQQHDTDFALDLKRIGADEETRTTVMVRNIPNKYNQQMLLEEVNVGHEGTYDFFYLPIDFKNRCNVGYCFINFLDPKHIPPFVHAFHGQRWKSFNSEKVCAVTFARIQGKQAMISRFQNSSLLEKDDEYQPLLFYSSGPDRGKPEPFPASNNARRAQQAHSLQQHGVQATQGSYSSHTSPIQSPPSHHLQTQSHSQTASPASTSRSITPPPPSSAHGTPRSLHLHNQQHQSSQLPQVPDSQQPRTDISVVPGGLIAASTVAAAE